MSLASSVVEVHESKNPSVKVMMYRDIVFLPGRYERSILSRLFADIGLRQMADVPDRDGVGDSP